MARSPAQQRDHVALAVVGRAIDDHAKLPVNPTYWPKICGFLPTPIEKGKKMPCAGPQSCTPLASMIAGPLGRACRPVKVGKICRSIL
jgi:hypothetical protein